ncbi:hypothetical protein GCM10011413_01840 [Pedobacter psychrotolerans]|uniref:Uncharacterized protein n=1 Tax=Pedobacter psychrotolerans TaxID=1843235 RepID=A0ABQ1SKJ7_9SPHI|nr:hypothetical protein GCM10011413_01840 [Pedobacter psychrotolerans]
MSFSDRVKVGYDDAIEINLIVGNEELVEEKIMRSNNTFAFAMSFVPTNKTAALYYT